MGHLAEDKKLAREKIASFKALWGFFVLFRFGAFGEINATNITKLAILRAKYLTNLEWFPNPSTIYA